MIRNNLRELGVLERAYGAGRGSVLRINGEGLAQLTAALATISKALGRRIEQTTQDQ